MVLLALQFGLQPIVTKVGLSRVIPKEFAAPELSKKVLVIAQEVLKIFFCAMMVVQNLFTETDGH